LSGILEPLLKGSAGKLTTLQNQGWNALQGLPVETGVSLEEIANTNAQNAATSQQQAAAAAAPGIRPGGASPYQR